MLYKQKDSFAQELDRRLLLRVDEVARLLGVSRATAYDLINRNQIPSIRLAGRGGRGLLRVPADALRRMIEQRTAGEPRDEGRVNARDR